MESLPSEVLTYLFAWLPAEDLARVARVCRGFWEAANVNSVWQERCRADYKVTKINEEIWTFRSLYTKLLYHYGYLLGVWKCLASCYGGLYKITFDGEKIRCCQYLVPPNPHIDQPLKKRDVFTVELQPNDETACVYQAGFHKGDEAQLDKVSDEDGFVVRNRNNAPRVNSEESDHERFVTWLQEYRGISLDEYLLFQMEKYVLRRQYEALKNHKVCCSCVRLNLRSVSSQSSHPLQPIKSGLFKGTYGSHGIELIHVTYSKDKLEGLKITGDPNVPAGKISLSIDLNRPMVLSEEQQVSLETLRNLDIPDIPLDVASQQMAGQPFIVPHGCHESFNSAPTSCRARFKGQGQIAADGFESPTFSPGHFVVFDDDWFGFIWMELRSFSMYNRVTEQL